MAEDPFYGWQVGDRCDHNVPGRSRSRNPYGGIIEKLELDGGEPPLPYAYVRWPDGVDDYVLIPEYLSPVGGDLGGGSS